MPIVPGVIGFRSGGVTRIVVDHEATVTTPNISVTVTTPNIVVAVLEGNDV